MSSISSGNFPYYPSGFHSIVNGFHGHINYGDEIKPSFPSLVKDKEPSTIKKVLLIGYETLENIAKEFWKYYKITEKVLKTVLKAVKASMTETEEKVNQAIAWLGLSSIISACFNIKSFFSNSIELEKCIKIKDIEGLLWALLELIKEPFDFASNLISFGKSLDKLIGITWIALFSVVTSPLSLALSCFDTIKSIYDTVMIAIEYSEMPNWDASDSSLKFKEYLNRKLGVTENELKQIEKEVLEDYKLEIKNSKYQRDATNSSVKNWENAPLYQSEPRADPDNLQISMERDLAQRVQIVKDRKRKILQRHTDKKIVSYMLEAKRFIEESPGKDHKAETALEDLKKMTARKIALNSSDTFFSIANITISVVAMIFPLLHPAVQISFSLAKCGFSIGKKFYQEYGLTSGLVNPEFLRASS